MFVNSLSTSFPLWFNHINTIGKAADAVVIGSRIVQLLEEAAPAQRVQLLEDFLKDIRKALDQ